MIIVNGWKHFVIIVNGWKLLTIITKRSILDVAAVLDPPLIKQLLADELNTGNSIAQKDFVKDLFRKCEQIRRNLKLCSHL